MPKIEATSKGSLSDMHINPPAKPTTETPEQYAKSAQNQQ